MFIKKIPYLTLFKKNIVLCVFFIFINTSIFGQIGNSSGWETNLSAGIDLSELLLINPKVGGGNSQIGIGASLGGTFTYQNSRVYFNGDAFFKYGIQKSGFGTGSTIQKTIDQMRFSSKISYKVSYFSKFFYAIDASFISQFTSTYEGNLARPTAETENKNPISAFLSPGTFIVSPGMSWKFSDQLSIYFSPAAVKYITVLDDDIAQQFDYINNERPNNPVSLHGTRIDVARTPTNVVIPNSDGEATLIRYYNYDFQLGALLKMVYNDHFFSKKLTIKSQLYLYSNYLKGYNLDAKRHPERIDVDWTNEISFKFDNIIKGLSLSLWTNLFYDYDVPVQKTDWNRPVETDPILLRTFSLSQQLSIKYIKKITNK